MTVVILTLLDGWDSVDHQTVHASRESAVRYLRQWCETRLEKEYLSPENAKIFIGCSPNFISDFFETYEREYTFDIEDVEVLDMARLSQGETTDEPVPA